MKYKASYKPTQHCWMLHIASVCPTCCMLLGVVRSCCAEFGANNSQHFCCFMFAEALRNNVGSVCTAFQHFWGHARSLQKVSNVLWAVSFPRCNAGRNIVGICCIRLHTTPANMDETTSNFFGSVMLKVVRSLNEKTVKDAWHLSLKMLARTPVSFMWSFKGSFFRVKWFVSRLFKPIRYQML